MPSESLTVLEATLALVDRQRTEALRRLERAMAMLKAAAPENIYNLAVACQIISRIHYYEIGVRRFWNLRRMDVWNRD